MRRLVDLPSSRLHKERSRLELGMAFSLTQHNFYDEKKMWAEPARFMGADATSLTSLVMVSCYGYEIWHHK